MITSRPEIFHAGTRERGEGGQRGLMDRARPGILNFLAKCPDGDACLANEFVTVDSRISPPIVHHRSNNAVATSLIKARGEKKEKKKKNASIHVRQPISSTSRETSPFFIVDPPETIRICVERDYRREERYRSRISGDLSVIYVGSDG